MFIFKVMGLYDGLNHFIKFNVVITAVPFYKAVRMGLQFSTAYEKEPTIYFGTTKTHLIVHRYRKTMHLIVVANCLSKRIDFARLFPNLLVGSETRFQDGTKKLAYDPARNPRFDFESHCVTIL